MTELAEIHLTVEEVEAIRLRDLAALDYTLCAQKMSVSRPTFHRIITAARQKIAQALIDGAALRVTGGHFQLVQHKLACQVCGHHWEDIIHYRRTRCPKCQANRWHQI